MSMHFFFVPAARSKPAASDLNALLLKGRILTVAREFVPNGADSGWAFCVEQTAHAGPLPASLKAPVERSRSSGAVDYKLILSEADFAVFATLRDLRKQLAQADSVPVYAVFSNEQLAAFVTRRAASKEAMAEVAGVGPARIAKYAGAVLACLSALPSSHPAP